MSYSSMWKLGNNSDFIGRVRVCAYIECQDNLDDPDHPDQSNLAYDTLRGTDHVMDAFVRLVARDSVVAEAAGDPPDQTQVTDPMIQAAVTAGYPLVTSLWYNPDGTPWGGAMTPPTETPPGETPPGEEIPPPEPSVSSVAPTNGAFHATTDITVRGTALTGTTGVVVGSPCLGVTVFDDSTVTATVQDSLGKGYYDVVVTVGGTDYLAPTQFQVI